MPIKGTSVIPERAELVFNTLARCAKDGERAPENHTYGCTPSSMRYLQRTGRIRTLMYHPNYRVIEILTGKHKGKKTAPPANEKLKPYLIIDTQIRSTSQKVAIATGVGGKRPAVSLSPILERLTPAYVD